MRHLTKRLGGVHKVLAAVALVALVALLALPAPGRADEPALAQISTLAGAPGRSGHVDGVGDSARFNDPRSVSLNASGTLALVADTDNSVIRRIDVTTGAVTTLAGRPGQPGYVDASGAAARFNLPRAVTLSADGTVALVADTDNSVIRRIDVATGAVTTLAGRPGQIGAVDGVGQIVRFNRPNGVDLRGDGKVAIIVDTDNALIRRLDVATGAVTTLAGRPGIHGNVDGQGLAARFNAPRDVAVSADGRLAFIADTSSFTVRRLDLATGRVTTIAGIAGQSGHRDGAGMKALFNSPRGIAINGTATLALVADLDNHLIREINLSTNQVRTLAGQLRTPGAANGAADRASFNAPRSVALSADGHLALVADTSNAVVRQIWLGPDAPFQPQPPFADDDLGRYFPETRHSLGGMFRMYWERNGRSPVFGFPLSEEFGEINKDTGQAFATQYFERERFEYHPENWPPYMVLLGRLGAELLEHNGRTWQTEPEVANPFPGSACQTFTVSPIERAVCGPFLEYWRSHGLDLGQPGTSYDESLALFGLPLTAPRLEQNPDGAVVLSQWFERARFELHTQSKGMQEVLLGRLGAEILKERGVAPR